MALSNAERQARYRERHRNDEMAPKALRDVPPTALDVAEQRIRALEEEVRHLKRRLAELNQHPGATLSPEHRFNSRPFTPVPKIRPVSRSR